MDTARSVNAARIVPAHVLQAGALLALLAVVAPVQAAGALSASWAGTLAARAGEPAPDRFTASFRLATSPLPVPGLRARAREGRLEPLQAEAFGTLQATFRATWSRAPAWSGRIGLSSALREDDAPGLARAPRLVPATPRLHLSTEGRLGDGLSVAIETDSGWRRRRAIIDIGLGVSYSLHRSFDLIGAYRWSDGGDDEVTGTNGRSAAGLGLRYRF